MEFDIRFCFPFLCFCNFGILPEPEECWHFLLLTISFNSGGYILDDVIVRHFLIEKNNSYEDFLEVIKNRYPNLREAQQFAKCKKFSSCHGIKKRKEVAEVKLGLRTAGKNADCRPGVKCRL